MYSSQDGSAGNNINSFIKHSTHADIGSSCHCYSRLQVVVSYAQGTLCRCYRLGGRNCSERCIGAHPALYKSRSIGHHHQCFACRACVRNLPSWHKHMYVTSYPDIHTWFETFHPDMYMYKYMIKHVYLCLMLYIRKHSHEVFRIFFCVNRFMVKQSLRFFCVNIFMLSSECALIVRDWVAQVGSVTLVELKRSYIVYISLTKFITQVLTVFRG